MKTTIANCGCAAGIVILFVFSGLSLAQSTPSVVPAASSAVPVSGVTSSTSAANPSAPAVETESRQWERSPIGSPDFFPLCVWGQDPAEAGRFKELGINTYIGFYYGTTEEQLDALRRAGMKLIADQQALRIKYLLNESTIIGWTFDDERNLRMSGNEPDNAQHDKGGIHFPVLPELIVADYKKISAADPSRPVLLNLGPGVAWDGWYGRGPRTNHPEDYAEYLKGCDIASFAIYPVNGDKKEPQEINNKLWLAPYGTDRLVKWGEGRNIVWNCIETYAINGGSRPTPEQVKAEVWMSIIHGSRGIIYCCHSIPSPRVEAVKPADKEMGSALAKINKQITHLSGVINSPTKKDAVTVESAYKDVPVDASVRICGATYIFAAAMRDGPTRATFTVKDLPGHWSAEVLGENRTVEVANGRFTDDFKGYGVHLYMIQNFQ